jgi:predicted dehydrogenase
MKRVLNNRPVHVRSSRRQFLKGAAAAASALVAAPYVVPSSVLGAHAPSNRVSMGIIGMGNQATLDVPAFLESDHAQVVAVCDVNTASRGYREPSQFLGRKPGQEKVNAYYAAKASSGQYKGCDAYVDFRELLARKDIDAVAIIVPDHWHAIMTVMAAKAGKDIYCEKPLSLTVAQGQAMVKAVRQHQRILQMGSHWRSSPACRRAAELVRNGRLGQIKRVLAFLPPNNAKTPGPGWKPMPVPEGFEYERWLGPAPAAPYHIDRCLYRFRFILDYSGGQVTNFGTHAFNMIQWGLGTDDTTPVEFEGLGAEFPPQGSLFTTATKVNFHARYANGVEMRCGTRDPKLFGVRFEGSEGSLNFGYSGITTDPVSIKDSPIAASEINLPVSNPRRKEDKSKLYIPDHVRNFLLSVKSRQDPIEPVEIAHHMTNICHLGNIAMLLNRKLQWDPVKEQFPGDAEANALLSRPLRGSWQLS